jgi:hypothetical protein
MAEFNNQTYRFLEELSYFLQKLGLPLTVLAWFSVFLGVIGMCFILRKHSMVGKWRLSLIVGGVALFAHILDYVVTIRLNPSLSFEANPIWCIVVEKMGQEIAKWYGLTGKILISILSFQFFAFYLIQRETLLPKKANGFIDFWKNYGRTKKGRTVLELSNITNLFCFLFSLSGSFYFYVVFLNSITDERLYMIMPSMSLTCFLYVVILSSIYLLGNYWKFRKTWKIGGE